MREIVFGQQCMYKTEYYRLNKKDGKKSLVRRECDESVNLQPGLGGYLVGSCKRGHMNALRDSNPHTTKGE